MHPDEEKIEEVVPDNIPGLIEGRIVHYVLQSGRNTGEHRPAIIVKVWNANRAYGMVNMQVFTDGTNDYLHTDPWSSGIAWATSVHYSETKEPGTWHWIEKA
jgi:hypothetical protein